MTTPALVAILTSDGEELRCCGTGVLLASRAVLVHPPLSRRLQAGTAAAPIRVAVCDWAGGRLDLLDVAELHVAEDLLVDRDGGDPEPVVSLELSDAAPAGTGCRGFAFEDEMLTHLRDPFSELPPTPWSVFALRAERPASLPVEPPDEFVPPDIPIPPILVNSNWICRFIGFICR